MGTRCRKTLMHIMEVTLVEDTAVTSRHHRQDSNRHNSRLSSNKSGLATNSESISWVNVACLLFAYFVMNVFRDTVYVLFSLDVFLLKIVTKLV